MACFVFIVNEEFLPIYLTLIYLIVLNRCLESVFRFLIYLIVVFRFLTRSESVFRFLTWRLGAEMSRCCNSITEKKLPTSWH